MNAGSVMKKLLPVVAVGFVVACLLVVGWGAYGVVQHGRQTQTALGLLDDSKALKKYSESHEGFPEGRDIPFEKVVGKLKAPRNGTLMAEDAWGRPLHYTSDGQHFALWSMGRNGTIDRWPGGGKRKGYDVDLVVYDGKFWQLAHGL